MDINFEYHDVTASDRLEDFTKKKLTSLQNKFDFMVRADVFFKTENTSDPETGMICGIRVSVPGPRLFAESSLDTFEAAVSETINDLERQLRKHKEKMKS